MGVGEDFRTLCGELTLKKRDSIARRYSAITKRLNLDFWNSDSEVYHSFYIGSYGRGTAVSRTSDVDMLMRLPYEYYEKYNGHSGNGQSALLQEVRQSIKRTYAHTNIGGDGQVVVVPFDDAITFEVLPAFLNKDESYTFPDSNGGGSWRTTNPKPEISAIDDMDSKCNGNLKELCRMARAWKRQWDVPISGLLIDTLAYYFIRDWYHRDKSYLYYDFMSRDYFEYLAGQDETRNTGYRPERTSTCGG